MIVSYFVDASYSSQYGLGVVGYMKEEKEGIRTFHLDHCPGMKNTQCEIQAFLNAVEDAQKHSVPKINIYTDCSRCVSLFCSDKSRDRVRYPYFFQQRDTLVQEKMVEVHKVQGHSKKSCKTPTDLKFQIIDKAVRRELRALVNLVKM